MRTQTYGFPTCARALFFKELKLTAIVDVCEESPYEGEPHTDNKSTDDNAQDYPQYIGCSWAYYKYHRLGNIRMRRRKRSTNKETSMMLDCKLTASHLAFSLSFSKLLNSLLSWMYVRRRHISSNTIPTSKMPIIMPIIIHNIADSSGQTKSMQK